jgi:hypothetical protein
VGPVVFVAAWVVAGWRAAIYSPTDEAISELAAVGASTRVLMTAGFVAFAVGVGMFAVGCRRLLPGWSWPALLLAAVATFGAAVFPLSGNDFDAAHGAFAGVGYLGLVAAPLLAAPDFRRAGRQVWMWSSLAVAATGALCLVASVLVGANGLAQRLGLTMVDIWIVVLAVAVGLGSVPDAIEARADDQVSKR